MVYIIFSLKYGLIDQVNYVTTAMLTFYTHIKQNHRLKAYMKFDIKSDQEA